MSRYLDRLIAHIQAPVTAIRPLVRPLYARSAVERSSAPLGELLAGTGTAALERGAAPATNLLGEATESAQAGATLLARSAQSPTPHDWGPPPDPAAGRARARQLATPMPSAGESTAHFTAAWPNPESRAAEPHTAGAESIAAASITAPSSAEVAAMTWRQGEAAPAPRLQPLLPRQARAAPAPAAPFAAAPAPDAVQIHIGRIEILAVSPAPAPRRAAAPQPRGVSLDEYLRRGNERAP
jgi:hypothetical protein